MEETASPIAGIFNHCELPRENAGRRPRGIQEPDSLFVPSAHVSRCGGFPQNMSGEYHKEPSPVRHSKRLGGYPVANRDHR